MSRFDDADSEPPAPKTKIRYHAQAAWRPGEDVVPTVANSPTYTDPSDLTAWIVKTRGRYQTERDFTVDAWKITPEGKTSLTDDVV